MQKEISKLLIGQIFTHKNHNYKLNRLLGYYVGVNISTHNLQVFDEKIMVEVEPEYVTFKEIKKGESFESVNGCFKGPFIKTNLNFAIYHVSKLAYFYDDEKVYKVEL
jgi:hypothetical protein